MKDGMIQKTATVDALAATDDELKKINAYTLEPLKAEDVYLFKIQLNRSAFCLRLGLTVPGAYPHVCRRRLRENCGSGRPRYIDISLTC